MTELIPDFLNYLERVRSYSCHTVRAYRRDLAEWQAYLEQQEAELEVLSMPLVRSYVALLRAGGALSNRSINRRISALKSFYKYLQNRASVRDPRSNSFCNPWDSISLLPQPQRLPNYLNLPELQRLAESCAVAFRSPYRQKLCWAILELGFSSGMRVSELCRLNVGQVHQRQGLVDRLSITGKGERQRFVFIGPAAAAALAAYLPEREKFLRRKFLNEKTEKALFCNQHGQRLQPRSVHHILAQLGRVAGLERPLHPHLLRHSFATALHNHGVGIRSVQELLGHSSLNSTQVYTHVGIQHLRDIHRAAHPRARKSANDNHH